MISLSKFFRSQPDPREARRPLWNAVVATARAPHWYAQGTVPDTLDGRFDMISLVMALVLHRIDEDPSQGLAGGAVPALPAFPEKLRSLRASPAGERTRRSGDER
jgi:hypothetical protein